jgi:hypothetical protein
MVAVLFAVVVFAVLGIDQQHPQDYQLSFAY